MGTAPNLVRQHCFLSLAKTFVSYLPEPTVGLQVRCIPSKLYKWTGSPVGYRVDFIPISLHIQPDSQLLIKKDLIPSQAI